MKPLALFLFAIAFALTSLSQQSDSYVDSLKGKLQKQVSLDSFRVKLLLELANSIYHNSPDEAMKYADESISISEKIDWSTGIAKSYRQKGAIYYILTNYMKALEFFQTALKKYKNGSDDRLEAGLYNNMANIYMDMGNFKSALVFYHSFLSMAQRFSWKREESIAFMNIGLVYMKQEKFDSALHFYNRSFDSAYKINDLQVMAYVLSNKGAALEKSGHYDKAIKSLQQSIPFADSTNDMRIKSQSFGALAEAYIFLKDYDKAEKYATLSLELSKSLNILQFQKEMYELLSDLYKDTGKPEKALTAYKTFILLRDSIMNEEKRSEMVRMEMQYTAEKKEAILNVEYTAQVTRQKTIKNEIIGTAAIILIGSIISFFFYKRKKNADAARKEAELNAEIVDTEMKALRAQMNPHFIFNSLNSISDYIANNKTELADEYLTKFAKLMRLVLENSEKKEVPLSDDLKALELYMQLESLRMNNKFSYEINVDSEIDKENTLVPPLLLQPFVENSIWHGIAHKSETGKIIVHVKKENGMINCSIEDDGVGRKNAALISEVKKEKKGSLGIKITKERIDVLNKIKNSKAAIQLTDLAKGTRVEVKLPIQLSI